MDLIGSRTERLQHLRGAWARCSYPCISTRWCGVCICGRGSRAGGDLVCDRRLAWRLRLFLPALRNNGLAAARADLCQSPVLVPGMSDAKRIATNSSLEFKTGLFFYQALLVGIDMTGLQLSAVDATLETQAACSDSTRLEIPAESLAAAPSGSGLRSGGLASKDELSAPSQQS